MKNLDRIYYKLYNHFGPQNWWPAECDIEMILGSILVQNTNWNNVTKALANFKSFEPKFLMSLDHETLCELIRPAGFYTRKAQTIQSVLKWLDAYDFDFKRFEEIDTQTLRHEILSIKGIGEETCDCILLYTMDRPVFVVDAYLRRLLDKMGYEKMKNYRDIQHFMMSSLPLDLKLYQEYHALIVAYGKKYLKATELPDDPLAVFPPVVAYSLKHLSILGNNDIMRSLVELLGYVERPAICDPFKGIVDAIIGQLISTQAANAISARFKVRFPDIESVAEASFEEIQSVGLTRAKTAYIQNLVMMIQTKKIDLQSIASMNDQQALDYLVQLKGIGVWSAKIILIHVYGRLDLTTFEDVALRNAVKKILNQDHITQEAFDQYFEQFSPYKSIACIYHWRFIAQSKIS